MGATRESRQANRLREASPTLTPTSPPRVLLQPRVVWLRRWSDRRGRVVLGFGLAMLVGSMAAILDASVPMAARLLGGVGALALVLCGWYRGVPLVLSVRDPTLDRSSRLRLGLDVIRRRKRWTWLALAGWGLSVLPCLALVPTPALDDAFLLCSVPFAVAQAWMGWSACPRCGYPFFFDHPPRRWYESERVAPWRRSCVNCGLSMDSRRPRRSR